MTESTPPEQDLLAAELALGLLDGTERAEALRLCLSDPAFARAVDAWSIRLSPLLDSVPPVVAPERAWHAVAARIGAVPQLANDATVRQLRHWRRGALLLGAIAACLALFLVVRPAKIPGSPSVGVSQLADASGAAILGVAYDRQHGTLRLSQTSIGTATKMPELWIIPSDGKPRSLGLLAQDTKSIHVSREMQIFFENGATLAITLEDPGTAPHEAPSSTPILTGKITDI